MFQVAETPESPYHAKNAADARPELARFVKDFVYQCTARKVASALGAESGSAGVWVYEFAPSVTWSPGGSAWPAGGEAHCSAGGAACGGLDLAYLFSAPTAVPRARRPASEPLRHATALYWTNFVKHHNPNGAPPPAPTPSPIPRSSITRGSLLGRLSLQSQLATLRRSIQAQRDAEGGAAPSAMARSRQLLSALAAGGEAQASRSRQLLSALAGAGGEFETQARLSTQQSRQQAVAALLTALRRRPSFGAAVLATSNGFVTWPNFNPKYSSSSSTNSNMSMVLTQPSPKAHQLAHDDACQFWDIIGFQ